ncbi:MAG: diacylglycerol kinase family lipid kinase [Asgard group archaeon]|nr:diacylglycerol kinase family lipid kinase [Asgard group archaeon]
MRLLKIIGNPTTSGGKAKKKWPEYNEALKEAGFDYEFQWTEKRNHATDIAREACDDHKLIVSYGGDGTINEIITGIGQAGFKSTLAILPVGRGNDNAFNIRQTREIDDLLCMLKNKEERLIDCIEINDGQRYCMGVAGAGLDADVSEQVREKNTRLIYYLALVRSIFRFRPRMMKIDIDDGVIVKEEKVLTAMVGNGQMIGAGMLVTPDAIIDDGLLDIMVVGNTRFIETLTTSAKLGKGTHLSHPKVNVYRGKTVTIHNESKKKIFGHAMGEYVGELPIRFACLHKKLKILKMSDEILEREGWLNCNAFSANVNKK